MRKNFYLPLLACVPIIFTSCESDNDYDRKYYTTYIQCFKDHRHLLGKGKKMDNICVKAKAPKTGYYGPFIQGRGTQARYYEYDSSGKRSSKSYFFKASRSSSNKSSSGSSSSAKSYDPTTSTSRGGFTQPKSSSKSSFSSSRSTGS